MVYKVSDVKCGPPLQGRNPSQFGRSVRSVDRHFGTSVVSRRLSVGRVCAALVLGSECPVIQYYVRQEIQLVRRLREEFTGHQNGETARPLQSMDDRDGPKGWHSSLLCATAHGIESSCRWRRNLSHVSRREQY